MSLEFERVEYLLRPCYAGLIWSQRGLHSYPCHRSCYHFLRNLSMKVPDRPRLR